MTATRYTIEFITKDNINKVIGKDAWHKSNEARVRQWMLEEKEEEEQETPKSNRGIDLSFRRY